MIKTIPLIVVALLLFLRVPAQFQGDLYRQYNDAVVLKNANTAMRLPWTGGVNNPQLAMADLNQDGRRDVVVFDQSTSKIQTLIATGNGVYKYDSKYEANFPVGIRGYIKLIDFNGNAVPDLIHRGGGGVELWYGYYENSQLKFKFHKDLYYIGGSGQTNTYVDPGSIPGILDIDGDGDIDVLAYELWGNSITLFQNCTKDDSLPADSVKMCLKDWCWGKTRPTLNREHELGYTCSWSTTTCKGCGRGLHKTTGSAHMLCPVDIEGDGDFDFFNAHESFPDIQLLYNGRNQYGRDTIVAQDTIWRSNGVTMHMPIFPAAFVLDIDHDDDEDLLFSPMDGKTENYNCISFYENTGNNNNKNFVHRKNNYLVDEMIDLGKMSYPVFYDYDKDGRKDLFIGSVGYHQYPANYNRSKIHYYRNTTSVPNSYSFELLTDDFLGLWSKDYMGASLAIGDLDNDSLDDLIIGHTDGTFSFYTNTAASDTLQPVWSLVTDVLKDQAGNIIDVGDYAAPAIYDIDADGKKDLVSGNQFGALYYYQNNGTVPGSTNLVMVTNKLGNIDLTNIYEPTPFTTPYFGPTDNTGKDYLVLGTKMGRLYRFDGFQNGAMPPNYTMIDSVYSYIDEHRYVAPAFANVDNDQDNKHELVLGNVFGGVVFYKQDFKVNIADNAVDEANALVYPNPADKVLNITWGNGFNTNGVTVQLISVMGQVVMQESFNEKRMGCSLDISGLFPGIYYCIIQSGPNRSAQPVTILK